VISFVGGERVDRRVVGQHFELAANIRAEDGPAFAGRLERAMTAYDPAVTSVQLNLLDSHDTPRLWSMLGGDARGVALATFILMTLPGAPSVFYGDEIGMPGEMDPFCRAPMRWDESPCAAPTGPSATDRSDWSAPKGRGAPGGGTTTRPRSWSWSMPVTRRRRWSCHSPAWRGATWWPSCGGPRVTRPPAARSMPTDASASRSLPERASHSV
jgi:glycosidase